MAMRAWRGVEPGTINLELMLNLHHFSTEPHANS